VEQSPFTIIAVVIHKTRFAEKHGESRNPYHFAMRLGLERVDKHLKRHGQDDRSTHVVFESRGRREDAELELEFRRVCDGMNYTSKRLPLAFVLADKRINSTGLQLADLTARPIGRYVMNPAQTNPPHRPTVPTRSSPRNWTVRAAGRSKATDSRSTRKSKKPRRDAEVPCRPGYPNPVTEV
jgi:hypothetical protein